MDILKQYRAQADFFMCACLGKNYKRNVARTPGKRNIVSEFPLPFVSLHFSSAFRQQLTILSACQCCELFRWFVVHKIMEQYAICEQCLIPNDSILRLPFKIQPMGTMPSWSCKSWRPLQHGQISGLHWKHVFEILTKDWFLHAFFVICTTKRKHLAWKVMSAYNSLY